jgi:hypothetical protein
MKKASLMILTALCLQSVSFAQHLVTTNDPAFNKVTTLIEEDLKKNTQEIQDLTESFTFDQKKELISEYEKDFTTPLVLNIFVPFAIGSFYQGDTLGGVIGLAGDLTGLTVMGIGFYNYYNQVMEEMDSYSGTSDPMEIFEQSMTYFIVGGIILTASEVFKILKPISYANSYNKALKKAVPMDSKFLVKMIPDLQLTSSGDLTPAVNLKISY